MNQASGALAVPAASRQPWLHSPGFDLLWIIGPAFLITAAVVLLAGHLEGFKRIPPYVWALLVVGVDVSHVYSTIFRTYLDKAEWQARWRLYLGVPVLLFLLGWGIYTLWGSLAFWRTLAYLAVFHFVRQQYGLLMLYGRGEREQGRWGRPLDQALIYAATLYPLLYWHTHPRAFHWFVASDFVHLPWAWLAELGLLLYGALWLAYLLKEGRRAWRLRFINWPKQLLLLGTALSWWVGIISFNHDLAFTAINVVAHGIPYMALIWVYGRKQADVAPQSWLAPRWLSQLFTWPRVPLFVGVLLLLAYLEEGLWDAWVWHEHATVFGWFHSLPAMPEGALAWLVPLLTLPQATHYLLDAFIWRLRTPDTPWAAILLSPLLERRPGAVLVRVEP